MKSYNKASYDRLIWENPNFPNKIRPDEDLIFLVREDISMLIFRAVSIYLVFFILLILRAFLAGLDSLFIQFYDAITWALATLLVVFFTVIFHNYYLSLQIITSERVIDIDQTGLFKKEVNSVPIQNIQDITFKKDTFLKTILNFGDIILQTSGNTPREAKNNVNGVVFNNVPNPKEITTLITEIMEQSENNAIKASAEAHAKELREILSKKILGS